MKTGKHVNTIQSKRLLFLYSGTTEDWYETGESHPYPSLINRKARQKLQVYPRVAFVGHFYFRRKLHIPQAHTYINQVRDPVRRVVSHYYYLRSSIRPRRRIKKFLKSKARSETLEECFKLQHQGCQNNVMTRFFCGKSPFCKTGSRRALEKAKYNIKHFYASVGVLEAYTAYLQVLHKRLPKFFPEIPVSQIRKFKYNPKYSFDEISRKTLREIAKANWADVELYSFIKDRFLQQARICGLRPSVIKLIERY